MNKLLLTSAFFFASAIFVSCKNDNKEDLNPNNPCNLTQARFSVEIKAVFQKNCLSCHASSSASSFGGGINLENHGTVQSYANNGKLMASVRQTSGATPMPPGGKLTDCEIKTLEKWVTDGAKND
jgi:uncharacterized membrane protein